MNCFIDIAKLFIFLINLTATLFLGLLIAGLLYLFFESRQLLGFTINPDLSPANPTAIHFILLLITLTLVGFFFILAFLGCSGTACHSKCLLGSYLLILTVLSSLTVTGLVFLFTFFNSEVDYIIHEARKTILYYEADDDKGIVRYGWDKVQTQLKCCGAVDYTDWSKCPGLFPGRRLPASCCRSPDDASDCVFHPDTANAFLNGCVRNFEFELRLIFWSVPFLVFSAFFTTILIYCNLQKKDRDYHHHVGNEHDFYLRPKQQIPSYYDSRHVLGYSYVNQPHRNGPPPYSH